MAEIDERYKRGMIYTIRNIKDDTMIYVGSTINSLSKRFNYHKDACKKDLSVTLYSHIIDNNWSDWYIELYENCPCNNRKELDRREGEVIREIGTINKNIAGRTREEYRAEYYEKNIDKIKEHKKEYRECNAEKIKKYRDEKVCCDICGVFSTKNHLPRHQKSKKCMSKSLDNIGTHTDTHI